MNTENIIENLMNGNIAAAKEETEDILYAKVSEAIDFITDDVVDAVYGIQEKKEKKKSAEDEITFAPSTEIEDDGEGMDPVDSEDSDIDNDGDSDESDDYLRNRRKVRKKAIKEDEEIQEALPLIPFFAGVARAVPTVIRGAVGLAKTKVGKEIGKEVIQRTATGALKKIKNRGQVPANAPEGAEEMQTESEDGRGDGRREFVYGMKISRYEKLTDKLKAKVKQQWHNKQAEEERVAGKNK